MARTIVTRDGDTPDLIAWREWGERPKGAEELLAANPGLAARGPVLPPGIVVTIPDLPDPEPPAAKLWE